MSRDVRKTVERLVIICRGQLGLADCGNHECRSAYLHEAGIVFRRLTLLAKHLGLLQKNVRVQGDWDKLPARLAAARTRQNRLKRDAREERS
jgi:hypothetical protein